MQFTDNQRRIKLNSMVDLIIKTKVKHGTVHYTTATIVYNAPITEQALKLDTPEEIAEFIKSIPLEDDQTALPLDSQTELASDAQQ